MNIKQKLTLLITFLAINAIVYALTEVYSQEKIGNALKKNEKTINTHYKILLHTQKMIATTAFESTMKMDRVLEIMAQAKSATKEQKTKLRAEMHKLLSFKYLNLKRLGVLQYHFFLPNNESFYRAHKVSKFGDDLTDIRADVKHVNETKKPIRGFVQGKMEHAFRNVFAMFDAKNNYLGAMEVSFSSENLQFYLAHIDNIHTHFLVNKDMFESVVWQRDDLHYNYMQSAESEKHNIALNEMHTKEVCIDKAAVKLKDKKQEIASQMLLDNPFSIYINSSSFIEALSFLPIKDLSNKTAAWIVSYQLSPTIESTLFFTLVVRIVSFFISLFIIYFFIKNIQAKQIYETYIKYQRLLELSSRASEITFWEFDFKTKSFTVNDLYYSFFATSIEKEGSYNIPLDEYFKEFIPQESQQIVIDAIGEAFTKTSDYVCKFEYTVRRRDGLVFPVEVNCYMSYDKDAKPSKAYGTKFDITQQKDRELALIDEKEKVKELLQENKTLLSIFDKGDSVLFKWHNNRDLSVNYVSQSATKLLGYGIKEFQTQKLSYLSLIHKDDIKKLMRETLDCIKHKKDFIKHKPYRIITKNNNIKWVMQYTVTQKDRDGKIEYFISYLSNITDAKISEKKIKNYLKLIDENIISSTTDLYGNIIDVSKAYTESIGYKKEELIGKNHRVLKDSRMPNEVYKDLWRTISLNKVWSGEVLNRKKDNSDFWADIKVFPIFDVETEEKTGYLAIRHNITSKKKLEEISTTDELTQLYNRRHFNNLMQNELNRAKREGKFISFMMIDIDHFKPYNDTYGHQDGDIALFKVAQAMKNFVNRAGDYAFRLGGEEFGIIFTSTDKQNIKDYALKLIATIEELKITHAKNSASKYLTISAGLAFSDNNQSYKELYNKADELLYKAKSSGRNRLKSELEEN